MRTASLDQLLAVTPPARLTKLHPPPSDGPRRYCRCRARSRRHRHRDRFTAASPPLTPPTPCMTTARMVASSRRASRVSNKTKLLVYRGSDKVDSSLAEAIVWNADSASDSANKQHLGAKGVETGELLVSTMHSALHLSLCMHATMHSVLAVKNDLKVDRKTVGNTQHRPT